MPFKHKDLHIKNEEGSGLILALMTLMVLSVLGASLGAITIGSYKLGDVNRDDNSAYYIAEAGANMAYEEMKNGLIPTTDKSIEKVYDEHSDFPFETQFGDQPKATIEIKEIDDSNPKKYIIKSAGEVAGKKRSVEKMVTGPKEEKTEINLVPEGAAIISNGKIDLKNKTEITGNIYITNTKLIDKHKGSEMVGKTIENANHDDLYNQLISYISKNYKTLEEGSFNIYENGDVDIGTWKTIDGSIIALKGDVKVGTKSTINGSIIALEGDVRVGNSSTINGSIIVPNGKIIIDNGSTINGSIIALAPATKKANVELKNGAKIIYDEDNDFLFNFVNDTSSGNTEDKTFTSEPAIESK